MNKHLFMIALALLLAGVSAKAEKFEFLNKLNVPVLFAIGTESQLLQANKALNESKLKVLGAGQKYTADIKPNEKLLFKEPRKRDIAYMYAFTLRPGKTVYVRLLEAGKGISFEPQTTLGLNSPNNIAKGDIALVRTVGVNPKKRTGRARGILSKRLG